MQINEDSVYSVIGFYCTYLVNTYLSCRGQLQTGVNNPSLHT